MFPSKKNSPLRENIEFNFLSKNIVEKGGIVTYKYCKHLWWITFSNSLFPSTYEEDKEEEFRKDLGMDGDVSYVVWNHISDDD